MDRDLDSEPARKRLRTSHACDVCRARKIRCDGRDPCASCAASDNQCTYGSDANSRGKSDLILEGVLRVERFLHQMNAAIATNPFLDASSRQALVSPSTTTATAVTTTTSTQRASFSLSAASPLTEHPLGFHPRRHCTPTSSPHDPNNVGLENAVLDSLHTSTTESILQWPHFDVFPGLRTEYISILELERSRPPLRARKTGMYPYVTADDVDDILASFERTVNFWYPTTSQRQLERTRRILTGGAAEGALDEDTPEVCLALLTMALGCAGQAVEGLVVGAEDQGIGERTRKRPIRRAMGETYFDCVLKKVYVAHGDVGSTATHCLLFIALYFAFSRRPLQAWEYINACSAKCLLLLSSPSLPEDPSSPPPTSNSEDRERLRRIFWACYVLESDYLAELSSLPLSGVARVEASVPLPGDYHTHKLPRDEEESSLYFLACISMRRLLNRVHQLLYARGTGAALDRARFPYVVAELDHQLDEWRDVLPVAFAFDVGFGGGEAASEHGGFLRQRYLTCRSVIYRPYLMWMLSGVGGDSCHSSSPGRSSGDANPEVLSNCKACLDACLLHILNLRGFAHTVFVDTWICSLSMAGAMLVLLAACRVATLRNLIGPEVLTAGGHLKSLLEEWQRMAGGPSSPSVDQSVRIIGEADRFIRQVYRNG